MSDSSHSYIESGDTAQPPAAQLKFQQLTPAPSTLNHLPISSHSTPPQQQIYSNSNYPSSSPTPTPLTQGQGHQEDEDLDDMEDMIADDA